jgi:hypothetical protein
MKKDIFKPTIMHNSLHEVSSDKGVSVVNFAISKNLIINSRMFPMLQHTWTSPDGKKPNQMDYNLIHRRQISLAHDV